MSERIAVNLGVRSYDIHVAPDLSARAGELIKPFARGVTRVVTDANVAKLHLEKILSSLRGADLDARPIVVEPGESAKSFAGLEKLCSLLLDTGVDRGGLIVALGGGVIGDLAGLAAGLLKRGVDFAQIPTTLLAQVDSSVGGKTAIDMPQGKNLIGLFHQPKIVVTDTTLLATLPRRELLSGYAEVAKYGALGDAQFFAWLEANGQKTLGGDAPSLVHAVSHSCKMKAAIVARDERESGERALLNLGHTFAHALEAATDYTGALLHGEAVAIGMALAFRLSVKLGYCPQADSDRIEKHLNSIGLPASLADISPRPAAGNLLAHMAHDKKAKDGELTFILAHAIGKAFVANDVAPAAVHEILSV